MELNEIVEQVKQVIQYSQNYRSDIELKGVEPMINDWYEAKQYFINAFGGPIYEVPGVCTFELDEQTQNKNFERPPKELPEGCIYASRGVKIKGNPIKIVDITTETENVVTTSSTSLKNNSNPVFFQ